MDNHNGNTANSYVLNQIADLIKEVSSLNKDMEKTFQSFDSTLNLISDKLLQNGNLTHEHSHQIEKIIKGLNELHQAHFSFKQTAETKIKDIEIKLSTYVKKPKWKIIWAWIIGGLGFISLILTNLKNIIELVKGWFNVQ